MGAHPSGSFFIRGHCWRFHCSMCSLDGTPFRFLMTPLQAMHQPTHVMGVVVDAELLRDEPGDARRRPQVRAVAASHRAFEQQLDQALELFRPQLGRSPRGEANSQCLLSAPPPGMVPAHNRTGPAANAPRRFIE